MKIFIVFLLINYQAASTFYSTLQSDGCIPDGYTMVNAVLDSFNQITSEDVETAMEQFNEEVKIHYEYHYRITILSIVRTVYVVILTVDILICCSTNFDD